MSRISRAGLVGCAATALLVSGLGGVARADVSPAVTTGTTITSLPAKALLNGGRTPAEFVKVQLAVPDGVTCATGMVAKVVGHRTAVTVAAAPDCTVAGSAMWTVTANSTDKKREAVVKFITTLPSGAKVGSLNVKVLGSSTSTDRPAPTVFAAGSEVNAFPAKVVLLGGATPQAVTVKVPLPTGVTCPADVLTRVGGQRDAVVVSTPTCGAGFATWTVTASTVTHKRHAVVKFVTVNPADKARTVSTLNVKVNPGARPAKPAKKPGAPGQG